MRKRRNRQEKCRALWGAWTGLQQLHLNLNIIHNDLSASNIFLNDAGEGIIADLEDRVVLQSEGEEAKVCEAKYAFHGTSCYGTPFAHCDVRRDQVALLMTSLQVLSGLSWSYWCNKLLPKDVDPSTHGFAANEDGSIITGDSVTYHFYARAIRQKITQSEQIRADRVLVGILEIILEFAERLDDIAYHQREDWDYKEVHTKITNALSDGRDAPLPN
jgi:serine/threonine protein kinase